MKEDRESEEGEKVLPENLGEVLLNENYRDYLDAKGNVIEERRSEYETFKWFVNNILFCVNRNERNTQGLLIKQNLP